MEQILAVVTQYLATVRPGTVAFKNAPQRLIVSGTDDRNVMSGKNYRKNNRRQLLQPLSDGGLCKKTAFSHRQGTGGFMPQFIKPNATLSLRAYAVVAVSQYCIERKHRRCSRDANWLQSAP